MFRVLVLVHRYVGITIGLFIVLWCLSGFVMMYVQYPEMDQQEYLAGLPDIEPAPCCVANDDILGQLDDVDEITVEILAGQAVLRARYDFDISVIVNLTRGSWFSTINRETAMQQADTFLDASGIDGDARFLARISRDQWTVSGQFDGHRPLYRFAADDDVGTRLYISGVSGQVVQATSSSERFWNRLGAVIHWVYPTALRQHTALWSQVVIWLTVASLFLVFVGIYIGIRQYGVGRHGTRSPYRGLNLWHHYAGLIFGLVTATWLFSGLISMNPWGGFDGDHGFVERSSLKGGTISSSEINDIVKALDNSSLPPGTVQLRSSMVDSELSLIASDATGKITRLNAETFKPEPLPAEIWQRIARLIRPDAGVFRSELIDTGDHYYFSHHDQVKFPAYRIIFDDADETRYYFDPDTAELIQKFDRDRRWYRWLFLGLHRGDVTPLMRRRPLWDLILLPLMLGATIGAVSGVWLGYRRLMT